MRNPSTTTHVVYKPDEETYLQRQLREFYNPRHCRGQSVADWAEPFDPLNGKIAGDKEKVGAFGKSAD